MHPRRLPGSGRFARPASRATLWTVHKHGSGRRVARARTTTPPAPQRAATSRPFIERWWPLVLAAIFLLAWIWRVLYLGRLSRTVLAGDLTEDSRTYWAWSKLLIEHGFMGKNPFYLGPLYPYVLALLRLAFGDSIGAVLHVQALWGAAAAA